MNVLSLFDGMGCGRLALQRAGIVVEKYYASEIDRYAIQVAHKNFPDIIEIGDVNDWKRWNIDFENIDLLIGGSPCQGFSNAGDRENFDDPRSKLFFVYVEILNHIREVNPGVKFLLENVKMKKDWVDKISSYIGVEPVLINSSLFSAQNRERYYWTNIPVLPIVTILDVDIGLESILIDVDDDYWLSQKERIYMDREVADGRTHWDFAHHSDTENDKSAAVVANFYKGVPYNVLIDRRNAKCSFWDCDFQDTDASECEDCLNNFPNDFQGEGYPTSIVRKFHPVECERLQTLPDNYSEGVSKTQRYKMLGNGWTVDVIAHIFKGLL